MDNRPPSFESNLVADYLKKYPFDTENLLFVIELDGIPISGHGDSVFYRKNGAAASSRQRITRSYLRDPSGTPINGGRVLEELRESGRLKVVPYKLVRA